MKLEDIKGFKNYLENECYCYGEIYEPNGFFFQVFEPEEECSILVENENEKGVICRNQILYITKNEQGKLDACKYDATENNIKMFKKYFSGDKENLHFDEFEQGKTQETLKEILKVCDAISI